MHACKDDSEETALPVAMRAPAQRHSYDLTTTCKWYFVDSSVGAKQMLRVKSLSSARRRRWQRWSEIQPAPFRQVYDFILQAVKGDKATADAIFEDYLAGKLSEELLSISRRWVSANQAGSSKGEIERNGATQRQLREHAPGGVGVGDEAFTAVA
jgi:hypothetical protein